TLCSVALRFLSLASNSLSAAAVSDDGERDGRGQLPELDLEDFEDDDCLEASGSDTLILLMHELADILDQVLLSTADGPPAWEFFDAWSADGRMDVMSRLAPVVFGRPYCEPGKLAWLAVRCLSLLRDSSASEALQCASTVDEDLLVQMTPRSKKFETRLHLVLRSPWPAFRLLDLMIRLHPENGSTRMGACRKNQMWNSSLDVFDWPMFKPALIGAVGSLSADEADRFLLRRGDGPLSRQYRARWLRIHSFSPMRHVLSVADDVFDAYREHHYKAGCHMGVISSYALQLLQVLLRDVEGRLQRYSASVANLVNMHAPFQDAVKTDWPLYRLLHFASLLQRTEPWTVWRGLAEHEPTAGTDAARRLVADVELAAASSSAPMVFLTSAWGWLAQHIGNVCNRWQGLFGEAPLVLLARDSRAARLCEEAAAKDPSGAARCVNAPVRLGIDPMVANLVAKYLALAAITRLGLTAVWIDLDVFVAQAPFEMIRHELAKPEQPDLVFAYYLARHLMSESLSPAVLVVALLLGYARWLRENPFLLDHQGWDALGDFAGVFDYKGRNITVKDDEGFGGGDGWIGKSSAEGLMFFHFFGARESQAELFELFYPNTKQGPPTGEALVLLQSYWRRPSSGPSVFSLSTSKGGPGSKEKPLHVVEISYAHGCCSQSLQRNRQQALKVGVDEARAYGKSALAPMWAERHELILSQKRGAGWWLWKPQLILQTLKDPAVPWNRGVVLWVDAGNYLHADPRPLLSTALQGSDVTGLRLKWCLEVEWTSDVTLRRLNMSDRYALMDRPQLGAYFLAFRKSEVSIAFVEEWLRLSQDPVALLGSAASKLDSEDEGSSLPATKDDNETHPMFQTHQADQSIFSLLFKDFGFRAISLEEGHKVVTLDRWRVLESRCWFRFLQNQGSLGEFSSSAYQEVHHVEAVSMHASEEAACATGSGQVHRPGVDNKNTHCYCEGGHASNPAVSGRGRQCCVRLRLGLPS
ncbi:unnamed protein product, partial [Polarella glacialis]